MPPPEKPCSPTGETVSHTQAMEQAKAEYRKYQVQNLSPVEEEYLQTIRSIEGGKEGENADSEMPSQGSDPLWAGILRVWIGAVVNIHRRLYMGNEQAEIDGLRLLYMLASVISLESIP